MDTFKQNKAAESKITPKQCADSGMALALIALICFFFLKHEACVWSALGVLAADMICPKIFKPFAFIWFGLARVLGTVMSKVLLSVVFYLIVTPVGLLRRLFGNDSLRLRQFKKEKTSVFAVRDHEYSAADLEKPY